jgi:hypothetical protein
MRRDSGGQGEMERCTLTGSTARPQAATVRLDDRAANGQAHAGAVRFSRKESIKDLIRSLRWEAHAGIADRDQYLTIIDLGLMVSSLSPIASFIASMPLSRRFINTCCSCTRSARILGTSSASSVRIEIE